MFVRKTPRRPAAIAVRSPSRRKARVLAYALYLLAATAPAAHALATPGQDAAVNEAGIGSALGTPFATRHAIFNPVAFDQLPGWLGDSLHESLKGLRQSCKALAEKPAWSALCAESRALDNADNDTIRLFFEGNFFAYHVLSPQKKKQGLITGYFEPELVGSHVRSDAFRYPVYGLPNDLLLLDASSLSGNPRQWFRIEDGHVLPAARSETSAMAYSVALSTEQPDIRDKRFRVRVQDGSIVPYYSRQEIEQRSLDAPILAWLDDPFGLYSMQVQGSGKIRMDDGQVVRVGFAEHNGQLFLSRDEARQFALVPTQTRTRGMASGHSRSSTGQTQLSDEALAAVIANLDAQPDQTILPKPEKAPPRPRPVAKPRSTATATADAAGQEEAVSRIVDLLSGAKPRGGSGENPVVSNPESQDEKVAGIIAALSHPSNAAASDPQSTPAQAPEENSEAEAPSPGAAPTTATLDSAPDAIPDPSYVFFQVIEDGPQGPVGALGVPLTPGRSLAMDPRTTPLGSPVFISTKRPGGGGPLQRLMFAQDTSGAIRGSDRGDLFWGTGATAGQLALATHSEAQMWLLLPRGQAPSLPRATTARSRAGDGLPECVVADPDLCVEE